MTANSLLSSQLELKPPFPPFDREQAIQKVRMAENAWNSKNPDKIALAYTPDSQWRNRDQFFSGREAIKHFLINKWERELEYRLVKELWAFENDRIAVRFAYEYQNKDGQWFRAYGNENWEFADNGLMRIRHASINDLSITEDRRLFLWEGQQRPLDHPGLTALGL